MTQDVVQFYGNRAGLYDVISRYTPGVRGWREAATAALDLPRGGTVVDVGCGTGATLPILSRAVGPDGLVIGVDLTPALLDRARKLTEDLDNVSVIRGDADCLPVRGPVDGILGTFVVGLLDDPPGAVDAWRSIVGATGRVALLDGVPTGWAHPLDRAFARFVRVGAPPGSREGAIDRLCRRVESAHGTLRLGSDPVTCTSWLGGFVRLTAGHGSASPTDR